VTSPAAYQLDSAYQGEEAIDLVQRALYADRRYALAFVDARMPPGIDGVETIEEIWKIDSRVQIVMCIAFAAYFLGRSSATPWRLGAVPRPQETLRKHRSPPTCQLADQDID
jgi:DNA-binding LytR/AlgR family response regulator